jgi:hypothetical protein
MHTFYSATQVHAAFAEPPLILLISLTLADLADL